jgi:putative YhbY family RNA-binding protein
MVTLTVTQRLELKAQSHGLNPVVIIGNAGLSASVLKEIDTALKSHQLIKIRAMSGDREQREVMLSSICEQLQAQPVQHIGKMLVVYRPDLDKSMPIKKLPRLSKSKKPLTKKQIGNRT